MSTHSSPRPSEPGHPPPEREELTAALAARRELGPDYDEAFLDGVVERLERSVSERVTADLRRAVDHEREADKSERGYALTVLCVTLGAAIPLTAIAVGTEGLTGLLLSWGCLTAINLGYFFRPRRR